MKKFLLIFRPVWGAVLFILLYVAATRYYPGGSMINKHSPGFSWTHNYWCDLLNNRGLNGDPNEGKSLAIAAMAVLCITLTIFWYTFPVLAKAHQYLKIVIQVTGILAMSLSFLLLTDIDHDLVTNLASASGLLATAGTLAVLVGMKWYGLFAFGLLNVGLVGLNNYLYYSNHLIGYLPVVQKISFVTFLAWICSIDIMLPRPTDNKKTV